MPRGERGVMGWTPESAHLYSRNKTEAELREQSKQVLMPEALKGGGAKPIEGGKKWQKVDRSRVKTAAAETAMPVAESIPDLSEDDIDTDEVDSPETVAEQEADAIYDEWIDLLTKKEIDPETGEETQEMSDSGKFNVDIQTIFTKYPVLKKEHVDKISARARTRNAPVKRDVYGQAGQKRVA